MEDKLGSAEALLDNLLDRMKRNPKKTLLVVAFIGAVLFLSGFLYNAGVNFALALFSNSQPPAPNVTIATGTTSPSVATSTTYAPQIIENSPHSVQVQGSVTVIAKPNPVPEVSYILKAPSDFIENGKYYTRIEVRIAYAQEGKLRIDDKRLTCKELSQTWNTVKKPNDPIMYSGLIWQLDCESKEPIMENADYFSYRNNK